MPGHPRLPEEPRHWDEGARLDEIPELVASREGVLKAVNRAIYAKYERASVNRRYTAGELDWPEMIQAGVQPDDPELERTYELIVEVLDLAVPIPHEDGWAEFIGTDYLFRVARELHGGGQQTID